MDTGGSIWDCCSLNRTEDTVGIIWDIGQDSGRSGGLRSPASTHTQRSQVGLGLPVMLPRAGRASGEAGAPPTPSRVKTLYPSYLKELFCTLFLNCIFKNPSQLFLLFKSYVLCFFLLIFLRLQQQAPYYLIVIFSIFIFNCITKTNDVHCEPFYLKVHVLYLVFC